ncbi:O-antigen ligase family protein [Hylemonella gracilis]|uniref:O-antigen ligase family protein n=1 Tax=Hylemonella gracilis TaxID=80880 RepID=UPI0009DD5637|nr:O-antigen ligase family protein [Hylemonella gracilis]
MHFTHITFSYDSWRKCLLGVSFFSVFGLLFWQGGRLPITDLLILLTVVTAFSNAEARAAIWSLFFKRQDPDIRWVAWPYLIWFLANILSWAVSASEFSNFPHWTLRFPLALCILALASQERFVSRYLLVGICVAAVSAAGQAAWDLYLDKSRATGLMNKSIDFGNWCALLGMLLIMAAALASHVRAGWRLGLLLLSILPLGASLVSATRGSLLALPVLALILIFLRKDRFHRCIVVLGVAFMLLAGALFFTSSTMHEHLRLSEAKQDIAEASEKNYATSIGARFVMWQAALEMFKKNPVLGVGPGVFEQELAGLLETNVLPPIQKVFGHAHSDILHTLATNGAIGVAAYFLLLIGQLRFFGRSLAISSKVGNANQRVYAAAGILVVGAWFCFGLTDSNVVKKIHSSAFPLLVCALATQLKSISPPTKQCVN